MRIALYHPEIAPNVGTIMRTCACFDVPLDIIHPIGFIWDDKRMKRSHMDYDAAAQVTHYDDFDIFMATQTAPILILSPHAKSSLYDIELPENPIFLFGRESDGIQDEDQQRILSYSHNQAIRIPIQQRSLNLAVCVGVVLGAVPTLIKPLSKHGGKFLALSDKD